MPASWLWISGLSFGFSLILNIVLIIAVWKVISTVLPLVNDLKTQITTITTKVDGIATNVKSTVDNIHTKTTAILGTAETASAEVTKKVSAASAAITAIFVVTRLVGAIKGMQQHDGSKNAKPIKSGRIKMSKN